MVFIVGDIMRLVFSLTEFDVDILDIPKDVVQNIKKTQKDFDKWLYDKSNKLTWDKKQGSFCFRGDAFVYWLNEFVLKERKDKAFLVESQPAEYDHTLPMLKY